MSRRPTEFQTIRSEGGLLPPDLLRRVVDPAGKVSGVEPTAYGLPAGERLNEAITQSWNRLRRHWAEFRAASNNLPEGDATTGLTNDKWSLPLLRELGFGFLTTTAGPTIDGKTYAISRFAGNTAIHLVGCGVSLDRRAAGIRGAAQSNPHGLVQEFLNRSTGHLWAIVSNGISFRILRDNQALSRQSFLEFDLEAMFDGEVYSDFVLLWLIAHATRFLSREKARDESGGTSGAETCWLETWSKEAAEQGVAALTDLRGGVEKALEILGQGFVSHPKNIALREALRKGDVKLSDFHGQLLRIVYRLIFLFVAEDRELEGISILHPRTDPSLVPPPSSLAAARERYAAHYSTSRFRELASRIKGSRHGDLWRQFQLLVGALSGEERFAAMRDALALPPLGSMLWNPASTALLNGPGLSDPGTELSNVDFLEALRHLGFIRKDKVLRPVDYKNLGSEEFGGVYESFLALTPQISGDGARFTFAEFAGNERKTSGSYYTPDSLVQCLLDSALDPVVNERLADAERLAKADWPAVEKEIQSDPAKRNYVLAFLTKRAGAARGASADALKRGNPSPPPAIRRWQLSEEAILAIKVCDKAVGSGHFLVGTGHRLARHLARVRAQVQGESEPSPLLYQTALRDVIGHCLYGVDINPMAVELCKVTLWLEAMEPGKPLSFLDHHIRCGNSLFGATPELISAGLPDEAFDPIEGDDKAACSSLKKLNRAQREGLRHLFIAEDTAIRERIHKAAAAIDEMSDSRPEDIRRKEAAFRDAQSNYDFGKAWDLANLWCAAFVIKKHFPGGASEISNLQSQVGSLPGPTETQAGLFGGTEEAPKAKAKKTKAPSRPSLEIPFGITTQHLRDFVEGGALPHGLLAEAKGLADQFRFFHYHLAFPEVFAQGGFDIVLGNPPWERLRMEHEEFFASAHASIATASVSQREKLIERLRTEDPLTAAAWFAHCRNIEAASSFVRSSKRFPLSGRSKFNTAGLFTELGLAIIGPKGRCGLVVPTGVATDEAAKDLFDNALRSGFLRALFDFINTKGIFPAVHAQYRFSLLTLGRRTDLARDFMMAFLLTSPDELKDATRSFRATAQDVQLMNPNTGTCPSISNSRDFYLLRSIHSKHPVMVRENPETNPWGARPTFMLQVTDEEGVFRDLEDIEMLTSLGYPSGCAKDDASSPFTALYEAKLLHQFDHRFATFEGQPKDDRDAGQARILSSADKEDPAVHAISRFWIPSSMFLRKMEIRPVQGKWFITYREVTNATNERTMIAAITPFVAAGRMAPQIYVTVSAKCSACFLAALNSFAFDFVARCKLTSPGIRNFFLKQMPVPVPASFRVSVGGLQLEDWIALRVLELTYTAWDLEAFAQDCGWSGPPFRWDEERRFLLRCELDAAFFHLYLGPETEWRQQPAALTQAFPTPRAAVSYILDTFPIVKRKDEAKFNGDYRTKRTILEIYDALTECQRTGKAFVSSLTPVPASLAVAHPPRFDRERVNVDVGNYILVFVFSLLRHYGGECDVMRLARAYALLLQRETWAALAEAQLSPDARHWVERFTQVVDGRWFLPILRQMDTQGMVTLEVHGEDVIVRQKDPQGPPSNSTVETDVFLVQRVLDLVPTTALAEPVQRMVPKAPRVALQEAVLPA